MKRALAAIAVTIAVSTAVAAASSGGPNWVASSPIPANANPSDAFFYAASCPPVGRCVATGEYFDQSFVSFPLLVTGAAGKWTPQAVPVPAGATPDGSVLYAVSCPSGGECVAVGAYDDAKDSPQGLIESETAGKWTALEAPLPADAGPLPSAAIQSVSCASVQSCVAVGDYTNKTGLHRAFVLRKAGGVWRAATAPAPKYESPSGDVRLSSVACPRSGGCVAIGAFTPDTSGGVHTAFILRESHGTWHASAVPYPASAKHASGGVLQSIACPAAGRCTAVGFYVTPAQLAVGLLLDEMHGRWRATKLTAPPSPGLTPASVACTAPGQCVAVGSQWTPKNAVVPLVVSETGGHWGKAIPVSLPTDHTVESYLHVVACGSMGYCAAGGTYYAAPPTGSGSNQGLLLNEVGGKWRHAVPAPLPTDSSDVSFAAAACSPHRGCVQVGTYDGLHALLERTTNW